jgi:MBG domain (YGX type)
LTVTVANATKLLNAPNPAFTGTIAGIKSNDPISATYTTTATQTSAVGTYPINATLVDPNGKLPNYSATIKPGTLTIGYRWDGFLQPINDTAHTQTTMSVFKAGSTVPVKFQLKDANGNVVQAAALPLWVTPVKVGTMTQAVDESTYTDPPTSGQTYRWDGSQYSYNWQSPKDPGGLYKICAKFDDGQTQCVSIGLK